jgi:hypothetical protein
MLLRALFFTNLPKAGAFAPPLRKEAKGTVTVGKLAVGGFGTSGAPDDGPWYW